MEIIPHISPDGVNCGNFSTLIHSDIMWKELRMLVHGFMNAGEVAAPSAGNIEGIE